MNGYRLRTEKKKEQILKTTFDLIFTYELDKLSIADIAKKANVSPVTIYNYFGSRDELIRMTFMHYMDKSLEKYEDILGRTIPFQQKMDLILCDRTEMANQLNVNLIRATAGDPAIREYLEQFYQNKSLPFFEKLINQGKKEGYIDPGLSMEAALLYIRLFKEALARPGFMQQANPSMLQDLNRLFYYGLIGRSPESHA
ncbi:TetR/AcrR family transcriptional regulator [Paenibacillus ehimensis]|uniref:TetR/AcrR family transcriptional regulator n=1 Tax=Paenibacillus ehimensis TaxID=79264 RepID=A0ABT8V416_9BACL|nr:TetR/AcrR family transcriptional regulator [Paenibacillus ehimensis]MDO3676170.1 TetR/AcrR family transcriptional regulator [Paenibacillus ehimensis]